MNENDEAGPRARSDSHIPAATVARARGGVTRDEVASPALLVLAETVAVGTTHVAEALEDGDLEEARALAGAVEDSACRLLTLIRSTAPARRPGRRSRSGSRPSSRRAHVDGTVDRDGLLRLAGLLAGVLGLEPPDRKAA